MEEETEKFAEIIFEIKDKINDGQYVEMMKLLSDIKKYIDDNKIVNIVDRRETITTEYSHAYYVKKCVECNEYFLSYYSTRNKCDTCTYRQHNLQ